MRAATEKTFLRTYASSSDQPAHSRNVIRIVTGRFKDRQGTVFHADNKDAQAYLSLRWGHLSKGSFSEVIIRCT